MLGYVDWDSVGACLCDVISDLNGSPSGMVHALSWAMPARSRSVVVLITASQTFQHARYCSKICIKYINILLILNI